ncbi:hypothetical protein H1Q63_35745 [Desmonostoc muscorum CCALA 125]|nr:hypothetical protein [Desmonostoc muscorum CCALA 125]
MCRPDIAFLLVDALEGIDKAIVPNYNNFHQTGNSQCPSTYLCVRLKTLVFDAKRYLDIQSN